MKSGVTFLKKNIYFPDGLPVFWKYRKPRDTRYRTFCHKTDVSNPSPAAMYLFIGLSLLTLCSISLLETLWTIGENFSDRQTDDRDKNNMFPHPEDGRQRISDRPAINGSNGRNGSCALRDV